MYYRPARHLDGIIFAPGASWQMAILGQVDCWGGRPQLWWTWRIFPARSAGSFYLALLLAVWPKHAQAANGTVVPSGAFAVPCKVNADCPYGRMDCNAGWPSTGPSVCRCAMWFYTDQAPRCRDVNMVRRGCRYVPPAMARCPFTDQDPGGSVQNTLAVSFMMIVVAACSLASARLHLRALRDHLSRPCPDVSRQQTWTPALSGHSHHPDSLRACLRYAASPLPAVVVVVLKGLRCCPDQ